LQTSILDAGTEASIRALIASGDHQRALERAKAVHKAAGTAASEVLLVDAYAERIRSLLCRNLIVEAKSLIDLVCERYPSARWRLAGLFPIGPDQRLPLAEIVRPLNDATADSAQRTRAEQEIKQRVTDMAALAACEALTADHPLRQAASAVERALAAVTSGPVADELITLPEISRRGALAPWKPAIRAIAAFYRGDDEACRRHLETIEPASVPSRLVPVMRALTGDESPALTPAAAALRAEIGKLSAFASALTQLDQAFASGKKNAIFNAIRSAVQECTRNAPEQLDALKRRIEVRGAMANLAPNKVVVAIGGPSKHDAAYLQLLARGLEESGEPAQRVAAARSWEQFRRVAAQEGWFQENGSEVAALALHVARLLGDMPESVWAGAGRGARSRTAAENQSLPSVDGLYRRACVLDPHREAFEQWLAWASRRHECEVERVAREWHRIRPRDTAPLLRLLKGAEEHGALATALAYVAKLERIDPLLPDIRNVRFRLLVATALRHMKQKKPALAHADVASLAQIPDATQGDRPAVVAAIRLVLALVQEHSDKADAARADVERHVGQAAGILLRFAVATAAKQRLLASVDSPSRLTPEARAGLPHAVARVHSLCAELKLKAPFPWPWMAEAMRQFPHTRDRLDGHELASLGDAAVAAGLLDFAYSISAAGLARSTDVDPARFLLLRARAVDAHPVRHAVCAKAAAELAREAQDADLAGEAVELARRWFELRDVTFTLAQAEAVLAREKAAPAQPDGVGVPDYADLLPICQCPECRRNRGEPVNSFDPEPSVDEDDYSGVFDSLDDPDAPFQVPRDLPPDLVAEVLREITQAIQRGESPEEFTSRLFGGVPRRARKRRSR
jgi:hypothetical protein